MTTTLKSTNGRRLGLLFALSTLVAGCADPTNIPLVDYTILGYGLSLGASVEDTVNQSTFGCLASGDTQLPSPLPDHIADSILLAYGRSEIVAGQWTWTRTARRVALQVDTWSADSIRLILGYPLRDTLLGTQDNLAQWSGDWRCASDFPMVTGAQLAALGQDTLAGIPGGWILNAADPRMVYVDRAASR